MEDSTLYQQLHTSSRTEGGDVQPTAAFALKPKPAKAEQTCFQE